MVCGTKTGATKSHQRIVAWGRDLGSYLCTKKETVSWHVSGGGSVEDVRDLGDKVVFSICRGNQK